MSILIDIFNFIKLNFGDILTFGAVLVAFMALRLTSKSFSEHNRPYVTINFEADPNRDYLCVIIRNTGIRGAEKVSLIVDPPPTSYLFKSMPVEQEFSKYQFSFLAPQQVVKATFDLCLYRYLDNQDPDNDVFEIKISYHHKKKQYHDSYVIDISYLKHLTGAPDSDVERGLKKIHEDLEKVVTALAPLKNSRKS
jgi:hypothetical protein